MSQALPPELRSFPQLFSTQHIELTLVSGEVTDDKHWSEAHVTGSGGGGHHGNIAATNISTSVVNKREIWLKTIQGSETSFVFNANEVKARTGNQVDLLCIDQGHTLLPVFVYNQAMGVVMSTDVAQNISTQRGWGKFWTNVHALFLIGYFIAMFTGPASNTVLTFVVLLALCGLHVPVKKREKAFKQAAYSYLHSLPKRAAA